MRKLVIFVIAILIVACSMPIVASANSAPPDYTGVGSGVTFDTCHDIEIASEVLDIVFSQRTATVIASYTMVNLTDSSQEIDAMFILPAQDTGRGYKCTVTQDDSALSYTTSNYAYADYNTSLTIDDWQYIVENGYETDGATPYDLAIATVNYTMHFEPNATSTVVVSYDTQLGGNISYATTVKLKYYLTPAQYWADFGNITINLTLDELHPALDKNATSLDFVKTGKYTYQYTSSSLPNTELNILARQSLIERMNISLQMSFLYFGLPAFILLVIAVTLAVIAVIIARVIRYHKGTMPLRSHRYFAKRGWAMLIVFGVLVVATAICVVIKRLFVTALLVMIYVDIVGLVCLLAYNILLLDSYCRNRRALAKGYALSTSTSTVQNTQS